MSPIPARYDYEVLLVASDWVSFQKISTPKTHRVNLWHTSFWGVLRGAEPKSAICPAQNGR